MGRGGSVWITKTRSDKKFPISNKSTSTLGKPSTSCHDECAGGG